MEDGRLVYLNNAASTWPKPPSVLAYVSEALKNPYLESGRTTARGLVDYPETARRALCSLMHTPDPDSWVFTANATDSLNLLIHGFAAAHKEHFHVITTEFEHNSVIRPLHHTSKRGDIELTVVPGREGYIRPEDIGDAIRRDTRLAVVSHGSNVIGTVQDIRGIAKMLKEEDIFLIVDGSQTAGQIPIDLARVSLDAFVFTGHKYLFGIPGTGGFILNRPEEIAPVRQGGTGMDSANPEMPAEMPDRFEAGTPNFPGVASLIAGIEYIEETGIDQIQKRTMRMTERLTSGLSGTEGVIIHHHHPDLGVISFNIGNMDPDDVGFILERGYSIVSRPGLHCAPWIHQNLTGGKGSVRISLSCMNTEEECDRLITAVAEIAHENC